MSYEKYKSRLEKEFSEMFTNLSNESNFNEIFAIAITKIKNLEELSPEQETLLVNLSVALEEAFKRLNRVDLSRLTAVPLDVERINQMETVIDLYGQKLERAEESGDAAKVEYWRRLMDKAVNDLENIDAE